MDAKLILDVCCGSRMFWFNKTNPDVLFSDCRDESHILCDGRKLVISPDVVLDFRKLDFLDDSFKLVVFDPPHFINAGVNGWQRKKYGCLNKETWRKDLELGFSECFRVLEPYGILIFKWNETQIPLKDILKLTPVKPLFGHPSGKASKTHWVCFMKKLKELPC